MPSKNELKSKKVLGDITRKELMDLRRLHPKCKGGEITDENTNVSLPVETLKFHGNFRERPNWIRELKAHYDDRRHVMGLYNKVYNQGLAADRQVDFLLPWTVDSINAAQEAQRKELGQRDRAIAKMVNKLAERDKLLYVASQVRGLGPITIGLCRVYLDLDGVFPEKDFDGKPHPRAGQEKCPHASSVWKYVGLHKASHERYKKGERSGGNKTLRTAVWNFANSQVKSKGPYRGVYDETKSRLEQSDKETVTRTTQGKPVTKAWKDVKPCHRHGAALRKVMKVFLFDWWYVGRDILGCSNGPCYAETHLGGGHRTSPPQERGWEW
jgi:hypothetical protein